MEKREEKIKLLEMLLERIKSRRRMSDGSIPAIATEADMPEVEISREEIPHPFDGVRAEDVLADLPSVFSREVVAEEKAKLEEDVTDKVEPIPEIHQEEVTLEWFKGSGKRQEIADADKPEAEAVVSQEAVALPVEEKKIPEPVDIKGRAVKLEGDVFSIEGQVRKADFPTIGQILMKAFNVGRKSE